MSGLPANGNLKLYGSLLGIIGTIAALIFSGIAYVDNRVETEAAKHKEVHGAHLLQPHIGAVTGDNLMIHLSPVNKSMNRLANEVEENSEALGQLSLQLEKVKTILEERSR